MHMHRPIYVNIIRGYIMAFFLGIAFIIPAQSLITVKQDGSGDFTTIQQGVDSAGNLDTVLVWPGTYYENVIIENKDVVLASLFLTTSNPDYIEQTIINGNRTGSCIAIKNTADTTSVCGFSLTNGSGNNTTGSFKGGGTFIRYASVRLTNCMIRDNLVKGGGGGLSISESWVYLKKVTVENNQAYIWGGGMLIAYSFVVFDTVDRCNIYNNYSPHGTDIAKGAGQEHLHLAVDTFTVLNPDSYYMHSSFGGIPPTDITWDINTAMIESVTQDLYVSPQGDNDNSGTTPGEPLKDIWFAMLKMEADSLQPDTIHIAPGTYSPSAGEKFPLGLKRYVSIKGVSKDSCILDAEDEIYHFHATDYYPIHFSVSDLTLKNGNGITNTYFGWSNIYTRFNSNFTFKDLNVINNHSRQSAIVFGNADSAVLSGCTITDNVGGSGFRISIGDPGVDYAPVRVENCIIQRNIPDYSMPSEDGYLGRGMTIWAQLPPPNSVGVHLYNCLISDNHGRTHPYGSDIYGSGFSVDNTRAYVINCTFGNNTTDSPDGGCVGVVENAELNIYNSILFNDSPAELYMYYGINELNVYNSLVEGGEEGINVYSGGTLYYAPTNIDADPMWDTAGMFPYSLTGESPCIDAGTLGLPSGIELPETDLAGNPRVYNGYIDMGAYEYGPWVGIDQYVTGSRTENIDYLNVFPNPFRFETTISYKNPEKGQTIIQIFDLEGQVIKTLLHVNGQPGRGEIRWQGIDHAGKQVPPGTYVLSVTVNGLRKDSEILIKQ